MKASCRPQLPLDYVRHVMDCSMDCEVCFLLVLPPFNFWRGLWLEREWYAKSCDLGMVVSRSCRGREISYSQQH